MKSKKIKPLPIAANKNFYAPVPRGRSPEAVSNERTKQLATALVDHFGSIQAARDWVIGVTLGSFKQWLGGHCGMAQMHRKRIEKFLASVGKSV